MHRYPWHLGREEGEDLVSERFGWYEVAGEHSHGA